MHGYGYSIDNICVRAPALFERRITVTDPITVLPGMAKRIGVAADHGGFELKQELVRMLRQAGYEVGTCSQNLSREP
jgi:hypothetical protein